MSEYIYGTDEQGGHWLTGTDIVRCRDCVHMSRGEYCYRNAEEFPVEPDGFCAWGERKECREMTSHEEIMLDDITYSCIVWTCDRCGCEVIVDIDGLPMVKDGKARNVVEPSYCPECGEAMPDLRRKAVEE